ncbi:N-acetylgalactosamine kinase [Phytophthora citrophthora]|uniref:N-acetylgalactosamine kinase n=1 Tax=Phytophthora citrophthora TaxID=4793 RepID=A0AAD9GGF6_9STRA|nr:N-acetylgalactosamine kinase [Phytophthora citrophthora]
MDRTRFRALPLPPASADDEASKKLLNVVGSFKEHFERRPAGVARSPGRVNLIGEHVDYEGYAVLPMAIEQSVYVAFNVVKGNSDDEGLKALQVVNAQPQYKAVTVSIDQNEEEMMKELEEQAKWVKYVLCGVLGIRDDYPELFKGETKMLQLLVDGNIPAGCGLSSSSALVVATALAVSSALQRSKQELLTREELAELCRRAEHRVGTMGGGMDQAVACLAQRGVALHVDFSSVPAKSNAVNVPDATVGVTFVVANSMVVAEKAVDAATRYNKRVVECAIAAKMMAKNAEINSWRKVRSVRVDGRLAQD